ncbi:hypothetical protein MRX96_039212 [Rhipicephalus microplus]
MGGERSPRISVSHRRSSGHEAAYFRHAWPRPRARVKSRYVYGRQLVMNVQRVAGWPTLATRANRYELQPATQTTAWQPVSEASFLGADRSFSLVVWMDASSRCLQGP